MDATDMIRTGFGYDVHRFDKDRPLILGGIEIPCERGLAGHSDADVLLHAVTDALLGAAALGDIGTHFPDSDEQFRGADSAQLLRTALTMVGEAGYEVVRPASNRGRSSVSKGHDVRGYGIRRDGGGDGGLRRVPDPFHKVTARWVNCSPSSSNG